MITREPFSKLVEQMARDGYTFEEHARRENFIYGSFFTPGTGRMVFCVVQDRGDAYSLFVEADAETVTSNAGELIEVAIMNDPKRGGENAKAD